MALAPASGLRQLGSLTAVRGKVRELRVNRLQVEAK